MIMRKDDFTEDEDMHAIDTLADIFVLAYAVLGLGSLIALVLGIRAIINAFRK